MTKAFALTWKYEKLLPFIAYHPTIESASFHREEIIKAQNQVKNPKRLENIEIVEIEGNEEYLKFLSMDYRKDAD